MIKKFLIILLLLPAYLLLPQSVQAECSDINFSSFAANPRSVTNARPQSEFTVRMTTTCPPADQDFILFFNTTSTPGSTPSTRLFEVQLTRDHFTRSGNGQFYEGVAQNTVQPFSGFPSTTHTLTFFPRLWDPSQNRVVKDAPSSMRETITRPDASPTPVPPFNLNANTGFGNVPNYDEVKGYFKNPLTAKSIPELIARIIRILLTLIASIAVIVIIISGFRMVLYGSNPNELAKAKSAIVWAVLGLVIALMSFSIVAIIQGIIQRQ